MDYIASQTIGGAKTSRFLLLI